MPAGFHPELYLQGICGKLPEIGYRGFEAPPHKPPPTPPYARKHVPWISFANLPNDNTSDTINLRFKDFPLPEKYNDLPTVSFVIPNLHHDMHDGSIEDGDKWLRDKLDSYYQWAKSHNSLLIVTFDENNHGHSLGGLTDPFAEAEDDQNRIATIFAGAHIRPCDYPEGPGITHVNILRTIEAMYGLPRSGRQQEYAARQIPDDYLITDIFEESALPPRKCLTQAQ